MEQKIQLITQTEESTQAGMNVLANPPRRGTGSELGGFGIPIMVCHKATGRSAKAHSIVLGFVQCTEALDLAGLHLTPGQERNL